MRGIDGSGGLYCQELIQDERVAISHSGQHGGAVLSALASQQEGSRFDSRLSF